MSRKTSLVVFDWDGTLMDSIGRIVSSMRNTAEHSQLPIPAEVDVKNSIGLSLEPTLERLFGVLSARQKDLFLRRYRDEYVELNETPSPLFPDTHRTLTALTESGYQLAVATGKARRGLQRVLSESQLASFFATSRCASESAGKPDPQMLYEIMNELDVPAEQTIMVGDSVHDMKMAVAAKVLPVGVSFGVHNAEQLKSAGAAWVVDSLSELNKRLSQECI